MCYLPVYYLDYAVWSSICNCKCVLSLIQCDWSARHCTYLTCHFTYTCTAIILFFFNQQNGEPGVLDVYQKKGRFGTFGQSMEWKQYVFKIQNERLKYYKSNRVSNYSLTYKYLQYLSRILQIAYLLIML